MGEQINLLTYLLTEPCGTPNWTVNGYELYILWATGLIRGGRSLNEGEKERERRERKGMGKCISVLQS